VFLLFTGFLFLLCVSIFSFDCGRRALKNFVLEDEQPIIEGVTIAVDVDQSYSANFLDVNAFETKWTERAQWKKKLLEEIPFIQKVWFVRFAAALPYLLCSLLSALCSLSFTAAARTFCVLVSFCSTGVCICVCVCVCVRVQVDEIIAHGTEFVNMVYTYRSCSKALPQLQGSDDPRKQSLYERTFEVLEPEIEKLKQLMSFKTESIDFLCQQVQVLVSMSSRDAPSENLIEQLVRLLDMFALLDAVKSMKACLNNDFSFFKRTFAYLKKNLASDEQNNENHQMYLFLANNNSITSDLKQALKNIMGYDNVFALLVDQCARHVEKHLVVTPSEEHALLRVMSYTLFLMDGPGDQNIFRSKKIKVQRFSALFKVCVCLSVCTYDFLSHMCLSLCVCVGCGLSICLSLCVMAVCCLYFCGVCVCVCV
jgi:CYRIA/CYRIB Rac1 binding domain